MDGILLTRGRALAFNAIAEWLRQTGESAPMQALLMPPKQSQEYYKPIKTLPLL